MRIPVIWRACTIAFISSFCVMVIELIAARMMAPHIGVSLYTWTSIIGVILAGIALGNFLGGRLADRYPGPAVLAVIFFAGGLLTIAILPFIRLVAAAAWFDSLPVMLNFTLRVACIFFLPAIVLSMVSPMVIKLSLPDIGKTGGVVGTIYALSTAGSILGTFLTGFFFILWFGTAMIVWIVAGVLILTGILAWFSWRVTNRWRVSAGNLAILLVTIVAISTAGSLFQFRDSWQEKYTAESNYYTINVIDNQEEPGMKTLVLDHLVHSFVNLDNPLDLRYDYEKIFSQIVKYASRNNDSPRLLHLGGGGYSFPRYMQTVYPGSYNRVVEIDPEVTRIAYSELGLPADTAIKTSNEDARLFLIRKSGSEKYDFAVGDVFNGLSTPYHLNTLEFIQLVKANLKEDGIYMVNIIDDFQEGTYLPAFMHTLRQAFSRVILFSIPDDWNELEYSTYVIAATDAELDLDKYKAYIRNGGGLAGFPWEGALLDEYLAQKNPPVLSDDYAPTDIMIAPFINRR